jgi:pantothenate synthetase
MRQGNGQRNAEGDGDPVHCVLIPSPRIDYVKICDVETMRDLKARSRKGQYLPSPYVGKTRLIDNSHFR